MFDKFDFYKNIKYTDEELEYCKDNKVFIFNTSDNGWLYVNKHDNNICCRIHRLEDGRRVMDLGNGNYWSYHPLTVSDYMQLEKLKKQDDENK